MTDAELPAVDASLPPVRNFSLQNILVLIVPVAAIVAVILAFQFQNAMREPTLIDYDRLFTALFQHPPPLKLDASRFVDADGDLVADPPTDPAKRIHPDALRFCAIPSADVEADAKLWKPFVDHLAKVAGTKVVYATDVKDKADQLGMLGRGRLHVTAFNTGAVPTAVNAEGFTPDAVIGSDKGYSVKMEILVPASSPIKEVKDLKGHALTFTDLASNTGFKAPLVLLRSKYGLEAGKNYDYRMSGGHDESIKQIAARERDPKKTDGCEAAAVVSEMLERAIERGVIKKEEFRSILSSQDFPPLCFGHVYNLDPELGKKIREAFLTFSFAGTDLQKFYKKDGETKFLPINYKDDWSFVRFIDESMVMIRSRNAPVR
jgi:phosphonate transport system substrate-binding protein